MDTEAKIKQRREEAKKAQARNQKRANAKIPYKVKRGLLIALGVVAAALVIFALVFPATGLSRRALTALKIGDTKISSAEFSYYYRTTFTNYYNTLVQYMGEDNLPIDTTKSLKKQTYSEGKSYADYFEETATNTLKRLVVLESEAKKAGFQMSEESKETIDNAVSSMETMASYYGMSVDQYLSQNYGMGFNMDLYKRVAEREMLASDYEAFKTAEPVYTAENLDAYYQEHKEDFLAATFRYLAFSTKEATDDTPGVSAEEAKAQAEAFLEKVDSSESFGEATIEKLTAESEEGAVVVDNTLRTNGFLSSVRSIDQNLSDWIFDEARQEGDKAVIENASGTVYYAVYEIKPAGRIEDHVVDVRHILIRPTSMSDEAAVAEAKAKAEDLLKQFLEGDATEELFATLATSNTSDTGSQSTGGLYTDVYPGEMVPAFNDWCFDPSRQTGDTGIVETNYGFHIMYFVSRGGIKWELDAETALREADYDAYYSSVEGTYVVSRSGLGMYYRSEPI